MKNIKKILLILALSSTSFIQSSYKSCSVEGAKKLQAAIKNKSLSLLFLNPTEKVFNKSAVANKKVDSKALEDMESLFICGIDYLERGKELNDELDVESYRQLMTDIIGFLSARDEAGQKKAISGADLFLTTPRIFLPFIANLKDYNRHAYIAMVLRDDKILKNKKSFDTYFANGGFETRFHIYERFINDETNGINIDENGSLDPKNYSLIANFALLKNLSVNQLKSLSGKDRAEEALKVVGYYNEFRVRAQNEIKSLEKKLKSFFTFNKKAIQGRIAKLTEYVKDSDQILAALTINDLYKQVPPSFIQKIANAPEEYAIIFGQTEALLKSYDTLLNFQVLSGNS